MSPLRVATFVACITILSRVSPTLFDLLFDCLFIVAVTWLCSVVDKYLKKRGM